MAGWAISKKPIVYPGIQAAIAAAEQAKTEVDLWQRYRGLTFQQFWNVIGWPTKDGVPNPIFNYELRLFDTLQKHRHVWVKKATGLGITEFILRYIAWLCTRDNAFQNAQICIVTGPRIELAITLISRLKNLFPTSHGLNLHTYKETVVILNGCRVEAFPSHHLDTMRGLPNVKFIFLDEADFFPPGQQKDARDVSERYIAKSDPQIVMVSTPNLPGGLFEQIEKEPEVTCLYHRVFLPYTEGLGQIYTEKDIAIARASPSFEREYNLKYGYGIGNIFPYQLVDAITRQYPLEHAGGSAVLAVDPAYGEDETGRGSKFALVGMERRNDGKLYVTLAEQQGRASPNAMREKIAQLSTQYQQVVVDGHYAGEIRDLRDAGVNVRPKEFTTETKSQMTIAAAKAVKEQQVFIHPAFSDLAYQLKAVEFNEKGHPDKKKLAFDLGDCFLMAIDALTRKKLMIG